MHGAGFVPAVRRTDCGTPPLFSTAPLVDEKGFGAPGTIVCARRRGHFFNTAGDGGEANKWSQRPSDSCAGMDAAGSRRPSCRNVKPTSPPAS